MFDQYLEENNLTYEEAMEPLKINTQKCIQTL